MSAQRIVGVLLAAGRGERFGGGKLLAPLPAASHGVARGTTIGVASALHLLAALDEVIAVVRPGDAALERALAATGARVVTCARADEGMGASLASGVSAAPHADGWLVALGDMPWIAPGTITALVDALREGASIVAPAFKATRGHPVGFAASFGSALMALGGDEGARAIVRDRRDLLRVIEVDDPGVIADVDRPDDLAT